MEKSHLAVLLISLIGVAGMTIAAAAIEPESAAAEEPAFPDGYRHWAHVKTGINGPYLPSHSGFHHIYANAVAMQGYKSGIFPDGSVLVFEVVESIGKENGDVMEGKRKLVDLMVKNKARGKETGGWMFEEFVPAAGTEMKRLHPKKEHCYDCHATRESRDFVFSAFRE